MGGMTGCLALADGAGPDTEWVGRAVARIGHRGPDGEGFFADPDVALAFRRLAIIDESAAGRQPMHSADGRYVMVFDGEIYNYPELTQRLAARGVHLRGRSCSEVLIEMYAWLGKDVVRQLRGMYAFAIWDRRSASGSIAVTSPESASALRSEANLSWGLGLDPAAPLVPGWRWPPVR